MIIQGIVVTKRFSVNFLVMSILMVYYIYMCSGYFACKGKENGYIMYYSRFFFAGESYMQWGGTAGRERLGSD